MLHSTQLYIIFLILVFKLDISFIFLDPAIYSGKLKVMLINNLEPYLPSGYFNKIWYVDLSGNQSIHPRIIVKDCTGCIFYTLIKY